LYKFYNDFFNINQGVKMKLWSWLKNKFKKSGIVAVIRLEGVISTGGRFGGGINDQSLSPLIEKAFELGRLKAVALIVNSPGGSPSQSSLIAARIIRLSKKKDIPVLAFCEDVAASGGYWLACSANEIYADENSIIGSIGVISAGFGFHEFISKQGVERRVYTSGEEKSMLDPFKPEKKDEVVRLRAIQKGIHENFKNFVTERRSEKITGKKIFTGEVWEAARAKDLGLIDGIGHLETVITEKFGEDVKLKKLERKRGLFSKFGKASIDSIFDTIYEKIVYSKFRL
jgi:serine protease SohB